jgi:hypothetical protein
VLEIKIWRWPRRKSGILAEQLAASEAKVRRLEAVAAAHNELQAQLEPQQTELRLWRSALAGVAGAGSGAGPEAVLQLLEELRGQVLTLKERAGEKEAEARRLQGWLHAEVLVKFLNLGSLQPYDHVLKKLKNSSELVGAFLLLNMRCSNGTQRLVLLCIPT